MQEGKSQASSRLRNGGWAPAPGSLTSVGFQWSFFPPLLLLFFFFGGGVAGVNAAFAVTCKRKQTVVLLHFQARFDAVHQASRTNAPTVWTLR